MAARKKLTRRARGGGSARLRKIARALEGMIGGDLERQLPISAAGDELDAICYGVNILVGELAFATANLRRARADAEAANAAKSSFLRAASHELRTPLAVIVWLAEAIKEPGRLPPERVERSLAGIRRSADELLRTTEAVLDLSRLDDPNARPEVDATDVIATIGEAVENLRPLAERKLLGLRVAVEPRVPPILMTNAQHFRQVVVNLVANAIKFTREGEIVVRVLRQAGKLAVDVEDPGIGIPSRSRSRIFEPFFQVDRSVSQRLGGRGSAWRSRSGSRRAWAATSAFARAARAADRRSGSRSRCTGRRMATQRVRAASAGRRRPGPGRSRVCASWSPTTRGWCATRSPSCSSSRAPPSAARPTARRR